MLLAFLVLVFITGGGSRSDIASLAPLRFVAVLAVGGALLFISRQDFARIRVPLGLLAVLAMIAVMQLVPLPPELWTALPGREAIARLDALVGLDIWRPISLSPVKTGNSLAALVVPLAALLWLAMMRDTDKILLGLVGIGVIGGLLGILQQFADPRSGIYFYEITNRGSATGFFANRNHHSVYLACGVMISLYLAQRTRDRLPDWLRWSLSGAAVFMALAIIANISRAGLLALFLVVIISAAAFTLEQVRSRKQDRGGSAVRQYLGPALLGTACALILALFFLTERSPALARILAAGEVEDTRDILLPYLLEMVSQFQPWGTGMGAFEYAFRMQEPYELLGPRYVNHAHNDWLQFLIEGGLPAVLISLTGVVFALVRIAQLSKAAMSGQQTGEAWLGLGLLVVLGVASLVDYPLRVPSIMLLAIIALAMFACPVLNAGSRNSGRS